MHARLPKPLAHPRVIVLLPLVSFLHQRHVMPTLTVAEVHNEAAQLVLDWLCLFFFKIILQVNFFSKVNWVIEFDFGKGFQVEHEALEVQEENGREGVEFAVFVDFGYFLVASCAKVVADHLWLNHLVQTLL